MDRSYRPGVAGVGLTGFDERTVVAAGAVTSVKRLGE
jgi:hypothetical protein